MIFFFFRNKWISNYILQINLHKIYVMTFVLFNNIHMFLFRTKIIWLSQMSWESGCATKLFQDDQEAQLVRNTTDFQDQEINTKRGTLSLSKWIPKLLQRAFGRQISKSGQQKDIGKLSVHPSTRSISTHLQEVRIAPHPYLIPLLPLPSASLVYRVPRTHRLPLHRAPQTST